MDNGECRIYLDNSGELYAVVDQEDYLYFSKWKWHLNTPPKRHQARHGRKRYARRSQSNGKRYKPPIYLHVAIKKRTGEPPPSALHTIVDHEDGNELNCCRHNLVWATPKQNAQNRKRRVKHDRTPETPAPVPS